MISTSSFSHTHTLPASSWGSPHPSSKNALVSNLTVILFTQGHCHGNFLGDHSLWVFVNNSEPLYLEPLYIFVEASRPVLCRHNLSSFICRNEMRKPMFEKCTYLVVLFIIYFGDIAVYFRPFLCNDVLLVASGSYAY